MFFLFSSVITSEWLTASPKLIRHMEYHNRQDRRQTEFVFYKLLIFFNVFKFKL